MIPRHTILIVFFLCNLSQFVTPTITIAQTPTIPAVYANLSYVDERLVFIDTAGQQWPASTRRAPYTLGQMRANPTGTDSGVVFDFASPALQGKLYYGFIPPLTEAKHPYPIYFNRSAKIDSGLAIINISNRLGGIYDIIDWQQTGRINLGYRIVNGRGELLYDGKIKLAGFGPFVVDTSIIEGPFINLITPTSAVVSFETNYPAQTGVRVAGRLFSSNQTALHHEIKIDGLQQDRDYAYTVIYGNYEDEYTFHTAPLPGSRIPFTFAYASDGRGNNGGGERDIWNVNAYMMKRLAVLVEQKNARFFQFTGDLIYGYTEDQGEILLEYANFKRAIEPYAHYLPYIAGLGNHESLFDIFPQERGRLRIDHFPFAEASSEAIFAGNMVNPRNGPTSEDGAVYDPDPDAINFPSYQENVFYYTYDNVGMIVLNSNYWFASWRACRQIGGNPHAYLMDNQLAWLGEILAMFESDANIDLVFVTIHCPIFPNGGHVDDDMWWSGDNNPRPVIAGIPVEVGIIQRRDQLLDLILNQSSKVIAVLTGDEHNYSRLRITAEMTIYPEDWPHRRLTNFRSLWQINNGAAGAPYYGREDTPWADHLQAFSSQNALVLFHVAGKTVTVEVINPDTMELLDSFRL